MQLLLFEQIWLLWRYAAAGNGHDDMVIVLALAKDATQLRPALGQVVGVWRR